MNSSLSEVFKAYFGVHPIITTECIIAVFGFVTCFIYGVAHGTDIGSVLNIPFRAFVIIAFVTGTYLDLDPTNRISEKIVSLKRARLQKPYPY